MSTNTKQSSLSSKRQRFVDEYCVDFNGTQAAIRAGYSKNTAKSQAERLLTKVDVKKAVEERQKRMKNRAESKKSWLLSKLKMMIDKCTGDEKWDMRGANGAIANMIKILGLDKSTVDINADALKNFGIVLNLSQTQKVESKK